MPLVALKVKYAEQVTSIWIKLCDSSTFLMIGGSCMSYSISVHRFVRATEDKDFTLPDEHGAV